MNGSDIGYREGPVGADYSSSDAWDDFSGSDEETGLYDEPENVLEEARALAQSGRGHREADRWDFSDNQDECTFQGENRIIEGECEPPPILRDKKPNLMRKTQDDNALSEDYEAPQDVAPIKNSRDFIRPFSEPEAEYEVGSCAPLPRPAIHNLVQSFENRNDQSFSKTKKDQNTSYHKDVLRPPHENLNQQKEVLNRPRPPNVNSSSLMPRDSKPMVRPFKVAPPVPTRNPCGPQLQSSVEDGGQYEVASDSLGGNINPRICKPPVLKPKPKVLQKKAGLVNFSPNIAPTIPIPTPSLETYEEMDMHGSKNTGKPTSVLQEPSFTEQENYEEVDNNFPCEMTNDQDDYEVSDTFEEPGRKQNMWIAQNNNVTGASICADEGTDMYEKLGEGPEALPLKTVTGQGRTRNNIPVISSEGERKERFTEASEQPPPLINRETKSTSITNEGARKNVKTRDSGGGLGHMIKTKIAGKKRTSRTGKEPEVATSESEPVIEVHDRATARKADIDNRKSLIGPTPVLRTNTKDSSKAQEPVEDSMVSSEWYFGKLDRADCEKKLLKSKMEGTFLVRDTDRWKGYTLSLYAKSRIWHLRITLNTETKKFCLGSDTKFFSSVAELITHFKENTFELIPRNGKVGDKSNPTRITKPCPK